MARGKHLFPFRTEQLSPSAPMVLGSQGPGRVGRRRFFSRQRPPPGGRCQRDGEERMARVRALRRVNSVGSCDLQPEPWRALAELVGARAGRWRICPAGAWPFVRGGRARQRGQADVSRRGGLTWTARGSSPAQRRPVRMGRLPRLAAIDLPVDVVVVLEQQERAGEPQGTERALRKRGSGLAGEHVFAG